MQRLFNHQIDFLKQNPDKTSLIWSCGTGKTRAAIEWAERGISTSIQDVEVVAYNHTVLVICPKALKANWGRECNRWGYKAIYSVLTKEEFRRRHKELPKFHQVIVDEVHNGFLTPGFKSQMSKALKWYLKEHNVPRVLLLTATPYTASPWNIYNLAYFTGHIWNWREFDQAFFYNIRMGHRMIPQVKKGSEEKLARIVRKIASVVDIHDVMDVPLQHHADPEYFSLSLTQIEAIQQNYDPLPIVRYTKQHEIENGVLVGNEFASDKIFSSDKHERILDLVKENPKIAIVCRYNLQIDALAEALAEYDPLVIRGDVKDRDAVTLQAEASERCVVLIQADCAEGYQLPSFPLCVFASQSYSYTKWEQLCGRFLRMDKPSRTTFLYLLTEGDSIDQAVYDAIKRKEDFRIELYAKDN